MLTAKMIALLIRGMPGLAEAGWTCLSTTLPGIIAIASLLCTWPAPESPSELLRQKMQNQDKQRYVCYYGPETTELKNCSLAILEPANWNRKAINLLKADQISVIGYCSIGEAAETEAAELFRNHGQTWGLDLDGNGNADLNGIWKSVYGDSRSQIWRDHVLKKIDKLLNMGFQGVFLDTIDTCDLSPEQPLAMAGLIREIRYRNPDIILIGNRGFGAYRADPAILNDKVIDGVMFECFTTIHDFNLGHPRMLSKEDLLFNHVIFTDYLQPFQKKGGILLSLDYGAESGAPSEAESMSEARSLVSIALSRARDYGFISLISTVNLDSVKAIEGKVSSAMIRKYGKNSMARKLNSAENTRGNSDSGEN
ncbi:MAG: hypothetical protein CVV64_13365 [Candidatus Wallbacteria bacterium HGW-Wallbacteria-1]|jgi:endo-alpha-1,4-polygalactosaminidase (GH114 family)|uniref:Glycoside-hydrolase family GH114 TIM-barrel domain-containing protein n=1 Tax=Candidatus Wallbacteria bacterium HGW-Wallbacteria-1 TaxID=2013854 RepID=A0A2N1PMT2_9BACT|nr:MAG: hypothetical protein CVV64_13365 [Candidatus Wallbacteria bacterium HGW-Wallbacteria-1]